MTTDDATARLTAVADALGCTCEFGLSGCTAEMDAAAAIAALDAYDRAHPIFADVTHYATIEAELRERIADDIEMADWSGLTPGSERAAAVRIARGVA